VDEPEAEQEEDDVGGVILGAGAIGNAAAGHGLDSVGIVGDEVLVDFGLFGFAFEVGSPAGAQLAQETVTAGPLTGMVVSQEHGQFEVTGFGDFSHRVQ
jgi:hypothetical protein